MNDKYIIRCVPSSGKIYLESLINVPEFKEFYAKLDLEHSFNIKPVNFSKLDIFNEIIDMSDWSESLFLFEGKKKRIELLQTSESRKKLFYYIVRTYNDTMNCADVGENASPGKNYFCTNFMQLICLILNRTSDWNHLSNVKEIFYTFSCNFKKYEDIGMENIKIYSPDIFGKCLKNLYEL